MASNKPVAGMGDLRTIANGLFPGGFEASKLTPEGRDEVMEAIDAILRMKDHLKLALWSLNRAGEHVDRLHAVIATAIEAIERGSTSAPILEILRGALTTANKDAGEARE